MDDGQQSSLLAGGSSLEAFMRACLRARWEDRALGAARAIAAGGAVPWKALPETAARHGVGPLLYAVTRGKGLLPEAVERALVRQYWSAAAQAAVLQDALEAVLRTLAEAGIRVAVLKGAALGEVVYRNAALRPMGDLDLLVARGQLRAAVDALAGLGYRQPQIELSPGYDLAYRKAVHLIKAGRAGAALDLHGHLLEWLYYQRAVPADWFWEGLRSARIAGVETYVLGPEAQLLHLCAHVVKHRRKGESRLLWLHDVAEVLSHYGGQLDWQALVMRAARYELGLPLLLVLETLAEGWGTAIPAQVLDRLRARRPSRAEQRFYGQRAGALALPADLWVRATSLNGWQERVHYVWRSTFPSAAYMRQRYGIRSAWLLPCYYAYRLVAEQRRPH